MTFADIVDGTEIFIDANTFIYAAAGDANLIAGCRILIERIERLELAAYTSAHVLSDVAHRLMTMEAVATYGWPYSGIMRQMKRHPADVQRLSKFRTAIEHILALGVRLIPSGASDVHLATQVTQQHGLLTNDALVVVLMQKQGLAQLASHDADFDRVPGIVRFSPI